ncbi:MAG TPA: glycosyltransferase [Gillisia sp.]|nr:glycosyltransferase [Gillisia sp.]
MQFLTILLIAIILIYAILMFTLFIGWQKTKDFDLKGLPDITKFSIIIPFRNESENLPQLLYSLSSLEYPKALFEVLMVNDESEDKSVELCLQFKRSNPSLNFTVLNTHRKTSSPKKDALTTAINSARFEYIITTDADCSVPISWLQAFNEKIIDTNAAMIAGPVSFFAANSSNEKFLNYLAAFQELDFMSLQAAGIGGFGLNSPFMCNAANMCYKKEAFLEVDGFEGNSDISSGDDVFLLQKFTEMNYPVTFLKTKTAIVHTKPQASLKDLFSQRIRWAAKTSAYKSMFAKLIGISVFMMNLSLVMLFVLILFELVPYQVLLFGFFTKFLVDLSLLYVSADFFSKKPLLSHYLWSSILYPFFTTSVAVLSLFKGFSWKGRSFKQ